MYYKAFTYLSSFQFWSGAKDNALKLTVEELDKIDEELSELYNEKHPIDATELNDLFWFDFQSVCNLIGLGYDEETGEIYRGECDIPE